MTEPLAALGDQAFMDAFLDLVLPPNGGVPGAGALGLAPAVVAGLQGDPLLGPMVGGALTAVRDAALGEHPEGLAGMTAEAGARLVEARLAANPFVMMGLLRHLYPAYYSHPDVLRGIGEAARPPFPEGFAVEATDAGLMERLRARRRAP